MHRIVGRDGGYPDFYKIRQDIILEYGKYGANPKSVMAKVGPTYRLHFQSVDELGARKTLNRRRPLVTTFYLRANQWEKFSAFYRRTPKGILQRRDIGGKWSICLVSDEYRLCLILCDRLCLILCVE